MNEAQKNNPAGANSHKGFIYVVDDEPMLLELATAILEPQGYHVQIFRDPDAALKCFGDAKKRPDLLITDYAMHNMNGMQLIEKFRELEPQQKILLVSGTVGEDIFAGSRFRPNHFLAKPYQAAQLTTIVQNLLA